MTLREEWTPGEEAWFEYHCNESHDSADAELWYHSHQRVTVLRLDKNDSPGEGSTAESRAEDGAPWSYLVRFADGLEWGAMEDELSDSRADWYRPDPPLRQPTHHVI